MDVNISSIPCNSTLASSIIHDTKLLQSSNNVITNFLKQTLSNDIISTSHNNEVLNIINEPNILITPLLENPNTIPPTIPTANHISLSPSLSSSSVTALTDSAATHTLFRQSDSFLLTNITLHTSLLKFHLPNHQTIRPLFTGSFTLHPTLPSITAYIFPDNHLSSTLISVHDLCELNYTVKFTNNSAILKHSYLPHLDVTISKPPNSRLWPMHLPLFKLNNTTPTHNNNTNTNTIPINNPHLSSSPHRYSSPHAHATIHNQLDAEYVQFAHACFFSPTNFALERATKHQWLNNFPRLTYKMVRKNPPHSIATTLGHLNQLRQGIQSTKPHTNTTLNILSPSRSQQSTNDNSITNNNNTVVDDDDDESDNDNTNADDINNNPYNETFVNITTLNNTTHTNDHINYADLTGKLPVQSKHGSNYILVFVLNNYIHVEPMKNKSSQEYIKAYQSALTFYKDLGITPALNILDNETSQDLESFFHQQDLPYQYVPPNNHRANKAERAIRDFKNHLLSGLATAHANFPYYLWEDLLPQAEITINHLRPASNRPTKSAYSELHGTNFDFLAHPISPPGTKVIVFETPQQRTSFGPHGLHGFYVGPALAHYRCWNTYITKTKDFRISDTVEFFTEPYMVPGASKEELMYAALQDFNNNLAQLSSTTVKKQEDDDATTTEEVPLIPQPMLQQLTSLRDIYSKHLSKLPPTTGFQRVHFPPLINSNNTPNLITNPQLITNESSPSIAPLQRVQTRSTDRTSPPNLKYQSEPVVHFISSLNLDANGSPLTLRSALSQHNAAEWFTASDTEMTKLLSTKCIQPIHKTQIPKDRVQDVTYYTQKPKEKYLADGTIQRRIRGAAGGDRVNYDGPVASTTAEMEVVKIHQQSVISDNLLSKTTRYMTLDIKDFYLGADLPRPEFMRIATKTISSNIIDNFNLAAYIQKDKTDSILFQIDKCLWGLPQAGLLSKQRLIKHLATHGYTQPNLSVPCYFQHTTNSLSFTLVVDDFGVKYSKKADVEHLLNCIHQLYKTTEDWNGSKYLQFTLIWDYINNTLTLSMPNYIPKALERLKFDFNLTKTTATPAFYESYFHKPHVSDEIIDLTDDDPMFHPPPLQQRNTPSTPDPDLSPPLDLKEIKLLQQIIGIYLYYARAVDPTMLTAINHIASMLQSPTQHTMQCANRLIAYSARYPNHTTIYHASDMILYLQSDASYLSRSNARSVAGGLAYLDFAILPQNDTDNNDNNTTTNPINGLVLYHSKIINTVCCSVAEAEYVALYLIAQQGVWLRTILQTMGYPQPPTKILCDNTVAVGIANDTVKLKRSKVIDQNYHWIRNQVEIGNFEIYWKPGRVNLADFFTKHLPVHKFNELKEFLVH